MASNIVAHRGIHVVIVSLVSAFFPVCIQLFLESSRCFLTAGCLQLHLTSNRFAALVALQLKAVELFLALRSIARRARDHEEQRSFLISQLLSKARPEGQAAPACLPSCGGLLGSEDSGGQVLACKQKKSHRGKILEEVEKLVGTRDRLRLGDVVQSLLFELSCEECMLQSHGEGGGVAGRSRVVPERTEVIFGQEVPFRSGRLDGSSSGDSRRRSEGGGLLGESETRPSKDEVATKKSRHGSNHSLGECQRQPRQDRPFAALAAAAAGVGEKRERAGAQRRTSRRGRRSPGRVAVGETERCRPASEEGEEEEVEERGEPEATGDDQREGSDEELSMSAFMKQSATEAGVEPLPFRVIHLSLKEVLLFIEVHPDAVASIIVSNVSQASNRERNPLASWQAFSPGAQSYLRKTFSQSLPDHAGLSG